MMQIDRRVRAPEFMRLLSVKRKKFYGLIKVGEIKEPVRLTPKDVFWYESDVKKVVEKYSTKDDRIACT